MHQKLGYWMPVRDEASAREAVRMSGLLVVLTGASLGLSVLIVVVNFQIITLMLAVTGAIAIGLVVIAFRIRAGHAGWVPVAVVLSGLSIADRAVGSYRAWQGSGQTGLGQIVFSWLIPIICLIFTIGGIRGWLWLRRNRRPVTF